MSAALKNGISFIPREDYDRLDRVNWSRLKLIGRSPAHYLEETQHPSDDTDPRKRGRAIHVATLEPERFRSGYVVWEGRRAGEEWEKFRRRHEQAGREILTESMHEDALAISRAVRANATAAKYLAGGKGEQTILWTCSQLAMADAPGYTFNCKSRVDFVSDRQVIVDLKSTKDASPDGFAREVMRYDYHAQAAFYVDARANATDGEIWPYVFVAVEPAPPFAVTVFTVPERVIDLGRTRYRELLDKLAFCRATNKWPAYADGEVELRLPDWADPWSESIEDLDLVVNQ